MLNVPLYLRLQGGVFNLSNDLFSTVRDRLGKLEFSGLTNITNWPDDALNELRTLSVLTLDGVSLESLPSMAFRGLPSLQSFTMKNVANLAALGQDIFDPLLGNVNGTAAKSQLRCVNVNIPGSSLACTCNGSSWLQESLARAGAVNADSGAFSDRFVENPSTPTGGCDVAVTCSGDFVSDEALRGMDITRVNLTAACAPPVVPVAEAVVPVMNVTSDSTGNGSISGVRLRSSVTGGASASEMALASSSTVFVLMSLSMGLMF